MRPFSRVLACAASAALAAGTLVLAAAPAEAGSPFCPSVTPAHGTVAGAVADDQTDWWYNTASAPRTVTLSPIDGDADLFVYNEDCSVLLCSSTAGGTATDVCTIMYNGTIQIGVSHYSGPNPINYTLTVASSGTPGYPSDDCALGAPLAEGFVAGNFVRVRSVQAGSNTTWVCVRADGPALSWGGKFVVTGPGVTLPALPSTDSNVTACSTTPGNTVPGPHPVLGGVLGDPNDPPYVPFLVDSYAAGGNAWVCVRAGSFAVRALVSTGVSPTAPSVTFQPDLPGRYQPPAPAAPFTPSGTCQNGTSGVTRYEDVNVLGSRTFLYTWQQSPSVLRICVRNGLLATVGGMLTVDTTNLNGSLPTVRTGSDTVGCPVTVARVDQPAVVEVRRSGTGAVPASVCLTVGSTTVRVTATTGNGGPPASVTWSPDPGTP